MARTKIDTNISYDTDRKKYYVTFDYGKDEAGNRVRPTKCYSTKEEAKKALKIFEAEKAKQTLVQPTTDTLKTYGVYWLTYEKADKKPTTKYTYRNMLYSYIFPYFGDKPLQKIKSEDIYMFFSYLMDKGLGQNTKRKYYDLLKSIFLSAELNKKIYTSPLKTITAPKLEKYENQIYDQNQVAALLKAAENDRIEIAVRLAVFLGVRRGEVLGLRWKNVNLDKRTINIVDNRTTAGGKIHNGTVKSDTSVRQLAIPSSLIPVLERVKREQEQDKADFGEAYEDGGYVFCYPDGSPYRPNYLSKLFSELLAKHGLEHIRFHDLRHSHATLAILGDTPLYQLSRSLGHSRTDITEQKYVKDMIKTKSAAINTVDGLIQAAMNEQAAQEKS